MSRIVTDKHGSYDLVNVDVVKKIPQLVSTGPGTAPLHGEPVAKLIFASGHAESTLLPYTTTHEAWLAVKHAEQHPVDQTSTSSKPS